MAQGTEKIPVVYLQRKPRHVGNYSVEFIFEDVRKRLKDKIDASISESRYESQGIFKRLYNCLEARWRSGAVSHITGDVNYLGIFLRRNRTINTVLDCVQMEGVTGFKYWFYKYFWLVLPEKRARYLTAISEATKREILRHHPCDPDKIKVIPVAISDEFRYAPRPFNAAKPRILQVGAAPNKNIPRLIAALEGIPCVLNIVGKLNEEYVRMCSEKQVELIYESGLSSEEMIKRYEMADIVSLVSTYEGFGMPILEAQAVGRVVISSNIFSMPEVAGDSAVLVDPLDIDAIRAAILRLINDEPFREGRLEAGRKNIMRFDPDRIAGMYFDLYREIYQQKKSV